MSNGNNNTLVLFDNIAAQDLLSKAKVWMIIIVRILFILSEEKKKRNLSIVKREENETDLIEVLIAPA